MRIDFADDVLLLWGIGVPCRSPYVNQALVRSLMRHVWLERLDSSVTEFFLPYSVDDEFVFAFRCTRIADERCALRCVTLDGLGFHPEEDDVVGYARAAETVVAQRERELLVVEPREFRAAVEAFLSRTKTA